MSIRSDNSLGMPMPAAYEKVRLLLPPSKYSMFSLITPANKTTGLPSDDTWGVYHKTKLPGGIIDSYSTGAWIGTFTADDVKEVLKAPLEDLPKYLGVSPVVTLIAAERMRQA